MKTYKVTCNVPEDKLHALIQYYEALGVTGFSVNLQVPVTQAPPAPSKLVAEPQQAQARVHPPQFAPNKPRTFHYVGGRKNHAYRVDTHTYNSLRKIT